jgi:16S rRNA (guanine527-N7)-methyltransferase
MFHVEHILVDLLQSNTMDRSDIADALTPLGVILSDEVWRGLEAHVRLLEKWQPAINLVGKSTLADIWQRHILDSLQILPLIPPSAQTLIDLGSGAGFPGLVVATARPDLAVRLVESDGRKAAFLGEVARSAAPNAVVLNARIDAVPAVPADVVTARALAPLTTLLEWADRFRSDPAICLFHKGESLDAELTEARQHWMMDVDRVPSLTAPGAAIVRVAHLRPRR